MIWDATVHGDWRIANFGIERRERSRLVLLDWARPTMTAPTVDLAYYLVTSGGSLTSSKEENIAVYHRCLARRLGLQIDESWWQPMLELSLLSAILMIGCFKAFFAVRAEDEANRERQQAELKWWSDRARAGARWLVSDAA
jgi:aminoglycoside phosphotransferase (APT) family kinase protein